MRLTRPLGGLLTYVLRLTVQWSLVSRTRYKITVTIMYFRGTGSLTNKSQLWDRSKCPVWELQSNVYMYVYKHAGMSSFKQPKLIEDMYLALRVTISRKLISYTTSAWHKII